MPNKAAATRNISRRIAQVRKARGLTQKQLAAAIGVSLIMVQNYESGRNNVPPTRLDKIAEVLGCEVADLFKPTGSLPPLRRRRMRQQKRLLLSGSQEMGVGVDLFDKDRYVLIMSEWQKKLESFQKPQKHHLKYLRKCAVFISPGQQSGRASE